MTAVASPDLEAAVSAEKPRTSRLVEIDALRGAAALAIVLFHDTTHFTKQFGASPPPTISFSAGHSGGNLFFIISGFVIFMTLEKTSMPMDFVICRFSSLFPTYWVAIVLAFVIAHLLGLSGKLAIATSLAMAATFTRWVEQPALRWIRSRYPSQLALAR